MPQQYEAPELARPAGRDDHMQGPENAPAILVEYGDFECPYCGSAYPVIKEVQHRLGDRLCFAFRHFPMTRIHPHAMQAAEAAEAAGAQGRFWEMHDLLYEHQDALDIEDLKRYAADLKLDTARFDRELDGHVYEDRIRKEFMEGVRSGVNGTPAFFIGGVRYDGPPELEEMLKAIEESIVKKSPPTATL